MFKVEAHLKEIATKQLTQRAARKEGAPRRPVTTVNCKALMGCNFAPRSKGIVLSLTKAMKPAGMTAGRRRSDIFSPAS